MRRSIRFIVWSALVVGVSAGCQSNTAPEEFVPQALPAAALDVPASTDGATQIAILSGGCFWTVEAVFEHVKGVEDVVSGYAGGTAATAQYAMITGGSTDHAESVRIIFRPSQITYGQILRVFFSVAHDPTMIDSQYPDAGREYRSEVFYANEEQRKVALAYIAQLDAARILPKRIATRVDPLVAFYPAEEEHQDYLAQHQSEPYIVTFGLPKLDALERFFPELYRTP
jgi:peptide-methionine (S)-S-oxide reductase